MEDLTGMRLGQYQVLAPLGEGGMAAVYKAYQPSVDRQVALKILPRHFASDPEFTGRFEQEAKLIAKLQHVHILPVYDFGEAEGYTYIAMPFIETGTLADLMHGEAMPLDQVRGIITQVGEALAYAHERGLVHRDVKPSNILIDHVGNCLLTDFGIAKMVEGTTKFTQTGAILGTPAYMSPEQIRGDKLDGRSDQYSLGIVLYEMATGRPPFRAETPPAIFVKHLHDPLPPPSTIKPDLPDDLERVILKCLAKEPAARYSDMRAMVKALDRAIPRAREELAEPGARLATTLAAGPLAEAAALPAAGPFEGGVTTPRSGSPSPAVPTAGTAPGREQARKIPGWAWGLAGLVVVAGLAGLGAFALFSGSSGAEPTSRPATRPAATAASQPTLPAGAVEPTIPPPTQPVLAAVGSCSDPLGCVQIAPGEPVHIAYLLSVSGPTADLGQDAQGGVQIAIDDRGGSLLGRQILLTGEDSGCTAEGGKAAAGRVVGDRTIVGVIGTTCSSEMTAAMEPISGAGLTIISPSNTSPALTLDSETWRPGYFRTASNDLFQGWLGARFAWEVLGVRTAATITDGGPYSDGLQAVFAAKFKELGGTITFRGRVEPGDTDLSFMLAFAAIDSPDLLYFPIFEPQGSRLVQQADKNRDLIGTILMGTDTLFTEAFPKSAGVGAVGMYLSAPYVKGPAYDEFLARWEARFGGRPPGGFHAFAYDATNILLNAIERVAGQGPDGTLYIGRQALRDAVQATSGFQGLTGLLDCGDKDFGEVGVSHGDCATGQALAVYVINSMEVNEGKWPPNLAWTPDLLTTQ
jgi:branched-chain amino acid transport system substrate-binding protein